VERDDTQLGNLPYELTSFIGRDEATAQVASALGGTRLLTLTGAGGVGKTRLALRVAAHATSTYPDGAWLVELALLDDASLVPHAIAQAIGLHVQAGQPLMDTLVDALGMRQLLLVLDNCEHLIDACAAFAARVLSTCSTVHILATSREPLRVEGEACWRLLPLTVPVVGEVVSLPDMASCEAVRLFVERARAVQPSFVVTQENAAAVARICQRLDGIPLAIELAAARTSVLTPAEIVQRLDDRFGLLISGRRIAPPRQRTLRAAVQWSYDLLSTEEQRLFDRLSVFAAPCTLDTVAAVCTDDHPGSSATLDLLSRLADRSLVMVDMAHGEVGTRYRLLETLRAFGQERLEASGAAHEAHRKYAAWLLAATEQAQSALHGPEQGRWLVRAEREHDHARSVLGWAIAHQETDLALRIARALWWSWIVHGRWTEALTFLQRVLALPGAEESTRVRGETICGLVTVLIFRGDLAANRPWGELASVRQWVDECLAIGQALACEELVLETQGLLLLLQEFGVPVADGTLPPYVEMDRRARTLGMHWGVCHGLEAQSRRELRRNDVVAAAAHLTEAVDIARMAGDTWELALALYQLGDVERSRGDYVHARDLYEESLQRFVGLGLDVQPRLLHNLGYVALARLEPREARRFFTSALAQFRVLGEQRGLIDCLMGLAAVTAADGHAVHATRLFGTAHRAMETLGLDLWVSDRGDVEHALVDVRRQLSSDAFAAAWAEGAAEGLGGVVARELGRWSGEVGVTYPPAAVAALTAREREVARLVAQGLSNREIATTLIISERTAANHLQRVLDKLGIHSRTQLAARSAEFGLARSGPAV